MIFDVEVSSNGCFRKGLGCRERGGTRRLTLLQTAADSLLLLTSELDPSHTPVKRIPGHMMKEVKEGKKLLVFKGCSCLEHV